MGQSGAGWQHQSAVDNPSHRGHPGGTRDSCVLLKKLSVSECIAGVKFTLDLTLGDTLCQEQ